MRKMYLQNPQTSDAAFVEQAGKWADALVSRESRGPGDTDNAMRRVSVRYGVSHSALWALRYRKPKGVLVGLYVRLHQAYEQECQRQMRLLKHELEVTRQIAGPSHAAVVAAEAVVRANGEEGA